jgi:hypothetical protein
VKIKFVYDLVSWLSSVVDTTAVPLRSVKNTAESKLSNIIVAAESVKTPLSQFGNF